MAPVTFATALEIAVWVALLVKILESVFVDAEVLILTPLFLIIPFVPLKTARLPSVRVPL